MNAMVETRKCNFCGVEIEPGSGSMYVKKDGSVFNFCTKKCYKNQIGLKRVARTTAWTQQFAVEKQARLKSMEKKGE